MASFRYYISNPFDGAIQGTNDETTARQFADCEDFMVVEAETGLWLLPDGDATDVTEAKIEESDDEDE